VALLRRASYVHDLGTLGVSNAISDKQGPLAQVGMQADRLDLRRAERVLAAARDFSLRRAENAPSVRRDPCWVKEFRERKQALSALTTFSVVRG
jgi:hypothetical protein